MKASLIEIPENPAPDGLVSSFIEMPDGCRLRCARAPARDGSKGTVVLLPGRNEFIEKYFETGRDLAARGFGCAILDWRGQGGSDRQLRNPDRGHIEDFDIYVDDLDQFFQQLVLPDCRPPFHILAHSMGALIALKAAPILVNRVRRMVLCAPLLALETPPHMPPILKGVARSLYAVGLGRLPMPGRSRVAKLPPFSAAVLTSDRARFKRNQAVIRQEPGLAISGPSVAWTRAMLNTMDTVRDPFFMAQVQTPLLFLAAGEDRVVSTPAIEAYARELRSASCLTIDGGRHELLQEADLYRKQVLAAFDAFIPGTDIFQVS